MTTFGLRPDDVVVDTRGNVLDGAAVKLYATRDDASNQINLLGTAYTDPKGRWTYTTALAQVWARTANGLVWRVDSDEEDHGQMSGLLDDDHPQYALADGTRGNFEASGAVAAHEAAADPHPQYLTQAEGDALYDPLGSGAVAGSYADATGQPGGKVAQTDGADGWTFVDTPSSFGYDNVFDAVTYGAAVDGTTDDTAAWQAAIDACAAAGGGTVTSSRAGVSIIAGPLQDTTGANAQLLLPSLDVPSDEQITVTISGPIPPPAGVSVAGTVVMPDNHLVLKSTLAAGTGAVLAGDGPAGSSEDFTFLDLRIENIEIRTVADPTISALDLRKVTQVDLDRVLVTTGSFVVTSLPEPTTATSYGIRLPKNNNGAHTRIGEVDVVGFYTGFEFAEHATGQMVSAWGCKVAAEFDATNHASVFGRFMAVHCQTVLKFTGAHAVDFWQLNIEHAASGWRATVNDIDDASNYGKGFIRWWVVLAGVGPDSTFTVNGGSNLTTSQVGAALGAGGAPTVYTYRDDLTASAGNAYLTLGATPVTNTPLLWVDGALQVPGTGYTISGDKITLASALAGGEVVTVWYQSLASSASASTLSSFTVEIRDDFNRANSATVLGSTSLGAKAWTQHTGTWGISTNKAYESNGSAGTVCLATVDSTVADCTLTATLTSASAATGGFTMRLTDSSNFYLAEVTVGAAGTPKIWKCVAGTYTTIATGASTTVATGSVITVELSGTSIVVKDDGVTVVSVTDSTFTAPTRHGMYVSAGSGTSSPLRLDDLSITA